jgi:hypothetical protein
MKRPNESDYTSHVAYTRAFEAYCDTLEQPEQKPDVVQSWIDTPPPKLQPEQEPVENVVAYHSDGTRTVRIAPKRPWVGLTDEDLKPLSDKWRIVYGGWVEDFAKEIETKLKERNT